MTSRTPTARTDGDDDQGDDDVEDEVQPCDAVAGRPGAERVEGPQHLFLAVAASAATAIAATTARLDDLLGRHGEDAAEQEGGEVGGVGGPPGHEDHADGEHGREQDRHRSVVADPREPRQQCQRARGKDGGRQGSPQHAGLAGQQVADDDPREHGVGERVRRERQPPQEHEDAHDRAGHAEDGKDGQRPAHERHGERIPQDGRHVATVLATITRSPRSSSAWAP